MGVFDGLASAASQNFVLDTCTALAQGSRTLGGDQNLLPAASGDGREQLCFMADFAATRQTQGLPFPVPIGGNQSIASALQVWLDTRRLEDALAAIPTAAAKTNPEVWGRLLGLDAVPNGDPPTVRYAAIRVRTALPMVAGGADIRAAMAGWDAWVAELNANASIVAPGLGPAFAVAEDGAWAWMQTQQGQPEAGDNRGQALVDETLWVVSAGLVAATGVLVASGLNWLVVALVALSMGGTAAGSLGLAHVWLGWQLGLPTALWIPITLCLSVSRPAHFGYMYTQATAGRAAERLQEAVTGSWASITGAEFLALLQAGLLALSWAKPLSCWSQKIVLTTSI